MAVADWCMCVACFKSLNSMNHFRFDLKLLQLNIKTSFTVSGDLYIFTSLSHKTEKSWHVKESANRECWTFFDLKMIIGRVAFKLSVD